MAGNAVSNILLTWYGNLVGRRRMLVAFSSLMAASGGPPIPGGTIPATRGGAGHGQHKHDGTEAGPFQSIEVGVLPPRLAGGEDSRVLGVYNVIGYSASALGALAASLPSYVEDPLMAIRDMYLGYAAVGVILASIYAGMEGLNSSKASAG